MSNAAELLAEAHRLYAMLYPTGKAQVILPDAERAAMASRYAKVYAELQQVQAAQAAQKAQASEWVEDFEAAIPQLVTMLPANLQGKVQAVVEMSAGPAKEAALRKLLGQVVNGGALKQLGPMGLMVGPMLSRFLRGKK